MYSVVEVSGPVFYVNSLGESVAISVGDVLPDEAILSSADGQQVILENSLGEKVAVLVQAPESLTQLVGSAEFTEQGGVTEDSTSSRSVDEPDAKQRSISNDAEHLQDQQERELKSDVLEDGHHHQGAGVVERENLEINASDLVGGQGVQNEGLISTTQDGLATGNAGDGLQLANSTGLAGDNTQGNNASALQNFISQQSVSSSQTSGQHDLPVSIVGTFHGSVVEDSSTSAAGQLSLQGGPGTIFSQSYQGQYGTLTIDGSGKWQYTLNDTSPNVQALTSGQQVHEQFVVHAQNTGGVDFSHAFNVDITGTNDAPTISGAQVGAVTEESQLSARGQLAIQDIDTGESHFIAQDIQGAHGVLHMQESGAWSYDLNNQDPAVQALGAGQQTSDTLVVHAADGTQHKIDIAINGSNDRAVINGTDSGTVTEDNALQATGQLSITDKDAGQAHFQDGDIAAAHGTLHLKADGSWTYDLDNSNKDVQALGTGKAGTTSSLTDTIEVQSADGTRHSITVTVNGTNDGPVLNTITAATGTEGDATATTGTMTSTDTDTGDSAAYTTTATVAGFSLNADGSYTFDPSNAAYNGLAEGDTQKITIPVTVTDGSGGTDQKDLLITVTGTNDKPVLDSIQAQSATEDGTQVTGTITSTDVDAHETAAYSAPTIAGFSLDPTTGAYTFDPSHAAYQHLAAGQDQTVSITVTVTDQNGGTDTKNLVITVHGTADSAVIAGTDTGSTTEETQLQASGALTITDKDTGQAHFQGGDITAAHGTLHLKADGSWTYDLDNSHKDVQALGTGKAGTTSSLTDTIEVQSADGTKHSITVTVNGTNDGPVLNTITAATATEGDAKATTGTMTSTDIDTGDSAAYSTTTTVAGFSLNTDGSYTFDPSHAAYNGLAEGDTQKITIPVTVTDGSGGTDQKDLVITVTGTNDKPVLDSIQAQSATEDGSKVIGTITSTDVDAHETAAYSAPTIAGFNLDPTTGAYTFDPSHAAYQHLAARQDQTVSIPVTVTDQNGGTDTKNLVITVHGTADAATFSGVDTGNITEDKNIGHSSAQTIAVSGSLTVTDPDAGQNHFQYDRFGEQAIHDPFHGSLHISQQGNWGYSVKNSALQYLHEGDVEHVVYRVHSADGTSHDITITVTGTNDAPVLAAQTQSVIEDGSALQGQMQATDVDYNSHPILSFAIANPVDGLTFNTNGSYTFDPAHAAYQHLGAGQEQTITIPVTVTDEVNATSTQNLTITVHGTNDAPVVSAATQLATGTEDTAITLTSAQLLTHATDIDTNDVGQLSITNLTVDHGSIAVNSDGTFTFTPAKDYNGPVSFNYDVKDAHGGVTSTSASLNLASVADAAVITDTTPNRQEITEDQNVQRSGVIETDQNQLTIHDPDGLTQSQFTPTGTVHGSGASATGTWVNGDKGAGQFILHADGRWFYRIDNSAPMVQGLKSGETFEETLTIHSADGTAHTLTVHVNGSNDGPTITAIAPNSATEDGAVVTGQIASTDLDTGDTATYSTTSTQAGFTLNADGSYKLDPTDASFQHLKAGEIETLTIPITVTDSAGATDTKDLVITITGTNDIPTISGVDTGTLKEDIGANPQSHELTATGKLDITDVDTGESSFISHGFNKTALQGSYGHVQISPNGDWSYSTDNTQTAIQALGAGDTLTDTITVTSKDGTTHDIVITINGTNDAPTVTSHVLAATEDTIHTFTTNEFGFTDVDAGAAIDHISITALPDALEGVLTLNGVAVSTGDNVTTADIGHLVFTPTANFNGVAHFDYTVNDGSANSAPATMQLNVASTNDISVISGDTSGALNEGNIGGVTTATGHLVITDVDVTDTPTFPDVASIATTYGHIAMVNGQWKYTVDQSKVQDLDPNAADTSKHQVIDTHTFTASDGSTQTVSVTIVGTNDAPVIESAHAAPSGSTSSALKIQDMEIVENPTGANVEVGADWGSETSNVPAGAKLVGLYKPGSDHNFIDPANPATMSTAHSGNGGYARVDNHGWFGANGIPDTVNTGAGGASGHGNAWQSGIALFEFPDGHQEIAVINRVCTGGGAEVDYLYFHTYQNLHLGAITLSGEASANEHITIKEGSTVVATATTDSHGHWEVAANALPDGKHSLHIENASGDQSPEHVYQVSGTTVTDVTPAGLDAEIKEDTAQATVAGELRASDADAGDNPEFVPQTNIATQYGHFTLLANGQYHYTIDNSNPSVNALGVHQTLQEHITVTAQTADGERVTHDVNVTINGSVDAPTLSATTATAQQGSAINLDLHASLTDTGGDVETLTVKISGLPDNAVLNHGTHDSIAKMWVLNEADLKGLTLDMQTPNFHGDLQFSVTATATAGGESESVTKSVSLHVNAAPVIANALTDSVDEDATNNHQLDLLQGATDAESNALSVAQLSYQVGSAAATSTLPAGLTIAADGHTLVVDATNPAFQHLAAGDTETITIEYLVQDTDGGSVSQTTTLTITGTNDTPVFGSATGSVTDQTATSTSGTITITDTDDGESSFKAASGLTGQHGTLDIDANGHWTYTLTTGDTLLQTLSATMSITDHVTVTSADGTTKVVDITIQGTNDAPTVTAVALSGTEDTDYQFSVRDFGFQDVDTGAALDHVTLTQLPSSSEGQLLLNGSPITSQNQVISAADIANLVFRPAADFHGDVHFSYKVSDGTADSSEATGTLSIANAVDEATVTTSSAPSGYEDTAIALNLNIDDHGDTLQSVTVTGFDPGTTFSAGHADGSGGWVVDGADVAGLKVTPPTDFQGTMSLQVAATTSDGSATATSAPLAVAVNVHPVTDIATASLSFTAEQKVITFGQDGTGSIMNQGTLNTPDHITKLGVEFNIIGGQQVATQGSHGATFLSYGISGNENEFYAWKPDDLTIRIGGKEYATGIDTTDGQSHRYSILWDSATGHLEVLVDGKNAFTQDNVAQGYQIPGHGVLALAQDQDKFATESGDHATADHGFSPGDAFHGQIFGAALVANVDVDKGLLASAPLGKAAPTSGLVIDMQMDANGRTVDVTGHHQLSTAGAVTESTVAVDTSIATPSSHALLHLNPHITAPADTHDQVTKSELSGFEVGTVVSDGHGHSVTIGQMSERVDITYWHQGQLTAQLPGGNPQNMDIQLTVTTFGSGGMAVTTAHTPLIMDPTRPLPNAQISGHDEGQTSEDSSFTAQLMVSDPDGTAQNSFIAQTLHGKYGDLVIEANGQWTYTPGAKAQGLAVHDITYDKFIVQSADGTQHSIKMEVQGANDGINVTQAQQVASATEDSAFTLSTAQILHASNATDIDGDTLSVTQLTLGNNQGTVKDNGDGTWTITPAKDFNGTMAVSAEIQDGHGETVPVAMTVDVANTADAAVITDSTPSRQTITEDNNVQTSGIIETDENQLQVVDPDGPTQSLFTPTGTVHGSGDTATGSWVAGDKGVGQFILHADGRWFYKVSNSDNHINSLADGDSFKETLTIHSADGTSHVLEVTVQGTNDAPVISSVDLGSTAEDTAKHFNAADLLGSATDAEGETLAIVAGSVTAQHGTLSGDAQNGFTFTPDSNFYGNNVNIQFQVTDGTTPVTGHATLDVSSVNDNPIVASSLSVAVTEDASATTLNLLSGATDVEGDTLSVSNLKVSIDGATSAAQLPPGISLAADGHTLNIDPGNAAFEHLGQGVRQAITVSYAISDGHGGTVAQTATVNITGTNDRPTASVAISGTEDVRHTFSIADFGFKDVDHDALDHVVITAVPDATHGHFELDGQPYHLNSQVIASDISKLVFVPAADYNGDVQFGYKASDGNAYSRMSIGTIHLVGTADAATITDSTPNRHDVTEDQNLQSSGVIETDQNQLIIHDPDGLTQSQFTPTGTVHGSGDSATGTWVNGDKGAGQFILHADGRWYYKIDNSAPVVQGLKSGETFEETLTIHGVDGTAHTLAVHVNGSDDGPTIDVGPTKSVTEDGTQTASGIITTNDADTADSASLTPINNQAGQYGHLTLQANGQWSYTLDNSNQNVQDLKQGQNVHDTFTITSTSTDGTHTTQTLTVNVQGAADAPILQTISDSGAQYSGPIEGNVITGVGSDQGVAGAATDTDTTANLVLHDIQIHDTVAGRYVAVTPGSPYTIAGVGTLEISANGHYSFTPEPGFVGKVPSMVYRVEDNGGGHAAGESSQNALDIEVTPGHVGPAILAALTGGGSSMSGTLVSATGAAGGWGVQDPHTGASTHAHHGQYGSLSVDPNTGVITYHVDAGPQGVQKTGTGVTGDEVEHFVITQGGSATTQVEVDVHLSAVSTHGHSGHYVQHITVKDLDASALPNVQHDEPDPTDNPSDIHSVALDLDGSHDGSPQLDFSRLDTLRHRSADASDETKVDERAAKVFGSAADNEADDALQTLVASHLAEHDATKKPAVVSATEDASKPDVQDNDKPDHEVLANIDESSHDEHLGGSSSSHLDSLISKPDDDSLPPI